MASLYVGNLPYSATEADVRAMFEQIGAVSRVTLINDRDTGKPKGFGFVDMDNPEEAISRLNGAEMMGRQIKVNEARPRAEKPSYSNNRSFDNGGFQDRGNGGYRDRGGRGRRNSHYDYN